MILITPFVADIVKTDTRANTVMRSSEEARMNT
jgi:hypothetical protein